MSDLERWFRITSSLVWVIIGANVYCGTEGSKTFVQLLWTVFALGLAGAGFLAAVKA